MTPTLHYELQHWSPSVRIAPAIELSQEEEAELTRLVRSKLSSMRLVERARIVLLAAQGMQNLQIAQEYRDPPKCVLGWSEQEKSCSNVRKNRMPSFHQAN